MQVSGEGKGSISEEEKRLLSKRMVSHGDHALPNTVTAILSLLQWLRLEYVTESFRRRI